MSDTPETDALREAIDNGAATEAEMTSLAGKLERERNELREVMAEIVTWVEDDLRDTVDAGYRAAVEKAQKLTEGIR